MTDVSITEQAQFGSQHIARGVGRLTQHVMSKASGSWVYTDAGKKLLDLTTGIGIVNLGHCHPKVTAAAQEQCATIVHAQVNIAYSQPYVQLLKLLIPKLQLVDPRLDSVFLWNSGAEAVEASVKLARAATGKQNIIVMQGSYHGRTFGTMAMTRSKTIYGQGFAPLMPGVFTTPFPYYSQYGLPPSTPSACLVAQSLHALQLVLSQQSAPSDTAAIILEPVLGEGGYVPAPAEFLHGLRDICDRNGILLIADEVQSGCGRTGKFWASMHSGVKPDIIVFAKGIANGFPLSGIASRKELMDRQAPGSMGGSYAGNAVACAAAQAVIRTIDEEKVLDNVATRSEQLVSFLNELRTTPAGSLIQDVRGQGLMIGVQFEHPSLASSSSVPSVEAAAKGLNGVEATSHNVKAAKVHPDLRYLQSGEKVQQIAPLVVQGCLKRDMLILSTSVFDVIRFIPALNISEEELKDACSRFADALNEVWDTVKGSQ